MEPIAVYVHTPFCPSKCGYCDFNSYAMTGEIVERTTAATIEEIRRSPHRGRPAKTVFFGGGTPTFLSADQITRLLAAVLEAHPITPETEVTSEANPGTVDIPKFEAMRQAGFNRISLGAQSFDPGDLIRLGRVHAADHVALAVGAARQAGFANVNLDLMFALPGQKPAGWKRNLETALALRPDHLSLYGLTIEANTRFKRLHNRGMLNLPDDDVQVEMYEEAIRATAAAGMTQYEISNFASPGRECLHNLCYWHAEDYLGYGPGAVGCVSGPEGRVRYTNFKHPLGYSERVESRADLWCDRDDLTPENENFERIMLGIRLNQGLEIGGLEIDPSGLATARTRGWIEGADRIALTPAGRHFCSEVALLLAP
ncbi:MAG: radical SAM family heme chaperone HemW [Fimbriimonadaceae bacterium]|nr:radical SAM family heme chaperone HemW [Fimbriimonadaceae bacterium]